MRCKYCKRTFFEAIDLQKHESKCPNKSRSESFSHHIDDEEDRSSSGFGFESSLSPESDDSSGGFGGGDFGGGDFGGSGGGGDF